MRSLIAAIGKNNELGFNGTMPWNLPEDLAYFKKITMGHTLIMGRKTFESLPGLLPGRKHVVLTQNKQYAQTGVEVIHSLHEINRYDQPFIIGGGQLYQANLHQVDKLYLTRIHKSFEADTFFPEIPLALFQPMTISERFYSEAGQVHFTFEVYERL